MPSSKRGTCRGCNRNRLIHGFGLCKRCRVNPYMVEKYGKGGDRPEGADRCRAGQADCEPSEDDASDEEGRLEFRQAEEEGGNPSPAKEEVMSQCRKVSDPYFRNRSWWDARLPRWHAKGLSDGQIARKVGCESPCVQKHRKRLGLPANREANRKRSAARNKHAHNWLPVRIRVATERWYQVGSEREADILDLLECGVCRPRDMAKLIGIDRCWVGVCIRRLVRAGLVERRGRGRTTFCVLAAGTTRKPPTLGEKIKEGQKVNP